MLGARVQQLSCLVPYSVGVMESKSAVTSGLKVSTAEEDTDSDVDDNTLSDD